MARRGRKPKPSALDKLDGGASHRPRNRDEPKPPPSDAACPAWLRGDRIARLVWEAEAPEMIRLGLLTTADRMLFAALCERASLYQRASQRLRRPVKGGDTLLVDTKANGKQPRPEIGIAKGALEGLRQIAAVFGMSPSDRKGLEIALGGGSSGGSSGSGERQPERPSSAAPTSIEEWSARRRRDAAR